MSWFHKRVTRKIVKILLFTNLSGMQTLPLIAVRFSNE